MSEQRLIRLLGTPAIEIDGRTVRLERRKAIGLLSYVAVNSRQAHSRETLATLFWPEQNRSQAFAYLRNALWTISKALGSDWVITEGETVQFNPDAGVEVDVLQFMHLASSKAIPELQEAIALYRGDFLAGFTLDGSTEYDDWQYLQSAELRRLAGEALDHLVQLLTLNQSFEETIPFAVRRVALDPLDEAAQRQLMTAYQRSGQRGAALRQFEELTRLLRQELDATPEPETRQLAESIRAKQTKRAKETQETAATHIDGIPRPATPLIGRSDDIGAILELFNDPACRIVTLVGQGGIGKTRLAIDAGRALLETPAFAISEARYVSLASVCACDYLISTFNTVLNFTPEPNRDAKEQLLNYLRDRSVLLVIDNFEHLLDGGELLAEISAHAPKVRLLITSRERLNLQEEYLYEVRGLTHPFNADDAGTFGSVEMFYQCARRVGYQPHPADQPHIYQICHIVEGLPLGIELAAGWLQALTPAQIALEIQRGLDILSTTARNVPERHRSLRAVFETSWERLSRDEKQVLSTISVFQGGFTLEAAGTIAGASPRVLLLLTHKSLLRRNNTRYEIHELLRQYVMEQLDPAALRAARDCHADYYTDFLAQRLDMLKGRNQRRALDEIEADLDNVRAMWLYAARTQKIAQMAGAFEAWTHYSRARLSIREARDLMEYIADELCDETGDEERLLLGRVLAVRAMVSVNSHLREEWMPIYQRALKLLRQFPDRLDAAHGLLNVAMLTAQPGYPMDEPIVIINEALPIFQRHKDRWAEAWATGILGEIEHMSIHYPQAAQLYSQSLEMFEEIGQPWGIGAIYSIMADQDHTLGEFELMQQHMRQAMQILQTIGDRNILPSLDEKLLESKPLLMHSLESLKVQLRKVEEEGNRSAAVWIRYSMAGIHLMHEEYELAAPLFDQVLTQFRQLGFQDGVCWTMIFQAQIALEKGHYADTERLLDQALNTIQEMNFPWGVSGAAYVRGDLELARGNIEAAHRSYAEALQVAYDACSVLQTLRHANGLAELHLRAGEYELAARIASYTEQNPATWKDIMRRSKTILVECAKHLAPERLSAIREEAATRSYDDVMAEVLPECV